MKLLIAVLLCTSAFGAPAFVQASNGGSTASSTTKTTGATATTVHNTIIVYVGINGSCPTMAITDTAGNTYIQFLRLLTNTNKCFWGFVARDIVANASNVVTATAGVAAVNFYLVAGEFSGIDATNPRDVTLLNNNQNANTTLTTDPFSTFWLDEVIIVGGYTTTTGAWTVGSGYTIPTGGTSPDNAIAIQYKVVSARQSAVTTSMTNASSGPMLLMGISLIAPVPRAGNSARAQ